MSKNFQWQSCSAINYLMNGINILARDGPVPVKFGPKCTNIQQEGCSVSRFTCRALYRRCCRPCKIHVGFSFYKLIYQSCLFLYPK